jgi:hypothetical protein
MALAVAAWYGVERLANGSATAAWKRWAVLAAVAELAIVYTHATGMLMIPAFPAYLAFRAWEAGPGRRGTLLKRAVLLHAIIAVASLPALGNSMVRSVSHTSAPSASQVWSTLTQLVVGPPSWIAAALMALVLATLLAGAIADRRVRALTLAFVVLPPALLLAISHGFRPAWHIRALLFSEPLIALALAAAVMALARRMRAAAMVVAAVLAMGFGVQAAVQVARAGKSDDFPAAAAFLDSRREAGDVVIAPDTTVFWGLARQYLGPDWGSPLRVQASDPPERWADIRAKLGPEWWRRLGLEAEGDAAGPDGRRLLVGWGALPEATAAPRIWLAQVPPLETEPLAKLGWRAVEEHDFKGLKLSLWRPAP